MMSTRAVIGAGVADGTDCRWTATHDRFRADTAVMSRQRRTIICQVDTKAADRTTRQMCDRTARRKIKSKRSHGRRRRLQWVRSPTKSCGAPGRSVLFFKKFNGRRGGGGVCVSTGQVVGAQRKESVSGGGHQCALTVRGPSALFAAAAAAAAWAQMAGMNGGGGARWTICRVRCRHESRSSARTSDEGERLAQRAVSRFSAAVGSTTPGLSPPSIAYESLLL